MLATFIGSSLGVIAANFVYAFFCNVPDWDAAVERSWFQAVALIAVGAALSIGSIAP